MKKLITLFVTVSMLLALVACTGAGDGKTDTTATDTTAAAEESTAEETTAAPTVSLKSVTLDGTPLSEYRIVYSKNDDLDGAYQIAANTALMWTDYEFDKLTAEYLRDTLKALLGVELEVVLDSSSTRADKEICIGSARGLDALTLRGQGTGEDVYAIKCFSAGQLVICGRSYGATYQAVDALVEALKAQNKETVDLAADYFQVGKADITVIACIGDSLTYGSTSKQPLVHSYPTVLGRLLWKTAVVKNYGLGGRTMTDALRLNDSNASYPKGTKMGWMHTQQYKDCMASAQGFDIVLVMLGTNDANTNNCTPSAAGFETTYINAYKGYVDTLRAKNPEVKICLMNCPYALNWVEPNMESYLRPMQRKAATQVGTDFYDMYAYTKRNISSPRLLPDELHPSEKGYDIMARGVLTMLKDKYQVSEE